jgi:hypothetical protein
MVVEKVNIVGVAALETENHSPVPADDHGPEALPVASHRMQTEAWHIHVTRRGGGIKAGKHARYLCYKVRPYPTAIALFKKPSQSPMREISDHAIVSSNMGDKHDLSSAFVSLRAAWERHHPRGMARSRRASPKPGQRQAPAGRHFWGSTKEFERPFGIPARTMESYEQGRRNLDGAMRALLRIIDREPKAASRALAR